MKRWQEDSVKIRNKVKQDKNWLGNYHGKEQLGRFRKRHPLDCGKPHCQVCHYDKYPKRKLSYQEVMNKLSLREQLDE